MENNEAPVENEFDGDVWTRVGYVAAIVLPLVSALVVATSRLLGLDD